MSDDNVIACPSCDKRFRLPARPPATYACSNCGTVMDLSAFLVAAPAAVAPASPRHAPSGGAARSRSSRARAGRSSRRSRGRAAVSSASRNGGARRRSRGGRDDYDDYDDDRGSRRGRGRQKSNNGLVIGLVAGLVAVGLLIAYLATRDDGTSTHVADNGASGVNDPTGNNASNNAGSAGTSGVSPTGAGVGVGTAATGAPAGAGTTAAGGATSPTGTAPSGDSPAAAPVKRRRSRMNVRKYELKVYPWHKDVPEDLRSQVDSWMDMYVNGGARDKIDGQEKLVEAGLKNRAICGRIISEFKKLDESPGLNNPFGKSRAASVEQLLRKIDGWQERHWGEFQSFQRSSPASRVMGIIKRWLAWWEIERWKTHPLDPWDEFAEGALREGDGKTKKKAKPKPKKGYDKLDD